MHATIKDILLLKKINTLMISVTQLIKFCEILEKKIKQLISPHNEYLFQPIKTI